MTWARVTMPKKIQKLRERIMAEQKFPSTNPSKPSEVLGVSPQTVMRDWSAAKLWLVRALRHAEDTAPGAPHGA